MNYGYIYKTTNLIDGKIYIGQRKSSRPQAYKGSGLYLKRAILRYGKENFKTEIICYLPTKDQIDEFEKFLIEKYREILGRENIYNIQDGGEGGLGLKHSSISKLKMSKIRKGWTVHSSEHFSRISKKRGAPWNKGLRKEDHPSIASTARSKIGSTPWNKNKKGVQKVSIETRIKMRNARLAFKEKNGYLNSPQARQKMMGNNNASKMKGQIQHGIQTAD